MIERERVTHTMMVPAQIIAVLIPNFSPDKLASLEMLLSLGAPLHRSRRTGSTASCRAASTSCTALRKVSHHPRPDDAQRKAGSVGVPPPFYEMRIVREDGRDAAAGDVGEIVGRGPSLMPGYYGAAGPDGGGDARWLALYR